MIRTHIVLDAVFRFSAVLLFVGLPGANVMGQIPDPVPESLKGLGNAANLFHYSEVYARIFCRPGDAGSARYVLADSSGQELASYEVPK